MANGVIDIRRYSFRPDDRLFLDSNIWLSVCGPVAFVDWRTEVYSAALRDIEIEKCQVFIDVLVFSEYINRFSRFEYEQLNPAVKPTKYRDFRDSTSYVPVAEEIAANARKILRRSTCCDSGFDSIDIHKLLSEYETGSSDFNDQIIIELCKAKDLKLVTHDGDFRDCGLFVITANKKLTI